MSMKCAFVGVMDEYPFTNFALYTRLTVSAVSGRIPQRSEFWCNWSGRMTLFFFFFLDGSTVHCGPSPPYWTFPHSVLFFDLSSHFFNFAFINICLYTIPPSVFWSPPQSTYLTIILIYLTCFSFTIHSTNMTNPIQPTYLDK